MTNSNKKKNIYLCHLSSCPLVRLHPQYLTISDIDVSLTSQIFTIKNRLIFVQKYNYICYREKSVRCTNSFQRFPICWLVDNIYFDSINLPMIRITSILFICTPELCLASTLGEGLIYVTKSPNRVYHQFEYLLIREFIAKSLAGIGLFIFF